MLFRFYDTVESSPLFETLFFFVLFPYFTIRRIFEHRTTSAQPADTGTRQPVSPWSEGYYRQ